jgi:hypothetical protein
MKLYTTELKAIDPHDGQLKTWMGEYIEAISFQDAQNYCEQHGLGYLKVIGELVKEIPTKKDGTPDWNNSTDFENIALN